MEKSDARLRVAPPSVAGPAPPDERLPAGARLLIAVAACAGVLAGAIALAYTELSLPGSAWLTLALIAALGMASERLDIHVYGDGRVSVSVLFMVTAAVLFGPVAVLLVCPAVALAAHVGRGRPLYKLIFNASVFVLAALAAFGAYRLMAHATPYGGRPVQAAAIITASLAHFAVSSALVASIIGCTSGASLRRVWSETFAWLVPHFVVMGFLAFMLVMAYDELAAYGVLGLTLPVVMTRFTMKQYVDRTEHTVRELREKNTEVETLSHELADAYNETLAAFVSALDTRDIETHGHSTRVAELSLELGLTLGVKPDTREWLDLKHGAMLHDIGKIGVPDAVLRKPGPLDAEEWEIIRSHSMQGYRMLAGVRFLATAAELVLCHHEHFDGSGYPRGLRGEQIPLAARIFAVADAYDAIMAARPYKAARTSAEAYDEIARHAGTQFDPRVVDALLARQQERLRRAA